MEFKRLTLKRGYSNHESTSDTNGVPACCILYLVSCILYLDVFCTLQTLMYAIVCNVAFCFLYGKYSTAQSNTRARGFGFDPMRHVDGPDMMSDLSHARPSMYPVPPEGYVATMLKPCPYAPIGGVRCSYTGACASTNLLPY